MTWGRKNQPNRDWRNRHDETPVLFYGITTPLQLVQVESADDGGRHRDWPSGAQAKEAEGAIINGHGRYALSVERWVRPQSRQSPHGMECDVMSDIQMFEN